MTKNEYEWQVDEIELTGFKRSKLLRTKLNWKLMKLNEEVTKMGGKTLSNSAMQISKDDPPIAKEYDLKGLDGIVFRLQFLVVR